MRLRELSKAEVRALKERPEVGTECPQCGAPAGGVCIIPQRANQPKATCAARRRAHRTQKGS